MREKVTNNEKLDFLLKQTKECPAGTQGWFPSAELHLLLWQAGSSELPFLQEAHVQASKTTISTLPFVFQPWFHPPLLVSWISLCFYDPYSRASLACQAFSACSNWLTGLPLVSSLSLMLSAAGDPNPHELGCKCCLLQAPHFEAIDRSSLLWNVLAERSHFQSISSSLSENQAARRRHVPQTPRHTSKIATNPFGVCMPECECACLCVCACICVAMFISPKLNFNLYS